MTVLEHMGGARERIYAGRADAWAIRAPPISTRWRSNAGPARMRAALSRRPGLPDDAFQHDGQLTKREVRAATLSALRPLPGQLLWDVGAGCGSIAIEWLRTHRSLSRDRHRTRRSAPGVDRAERGALGTPHLKLVEGEAPHALTACLTPDAIFIGGGLGDRGRGRGLLGAR